MYFTGNVISSEDSGLSTGAAVAITFVVTLIISITVTAVTTFIVTHYVSVKKVFQKADDNVYTLNKQPPQDQALYEQVCLPSRTVAKDDLKLQPNPAYGIYKSSCDHEYQSCLWELQVNDSAAIYVIPSTVKAICVFH